MWQRFMDRVLDETKVQERFTEYDLWAKIGSDAASLEKARALLQHADARTTARFYRRQPEPVRGAPRRALGCTIRHRTGTFTVAGQMKGRHCRPFNLTLERARARVARAAAAIKRSSD
jgi:hypothetical protein